MLFTFFTAVISTLGLLSIGGDWYLIKTSWLKINNCYYFPAGTNNLFDYFCGMSTNEFLTYRANQVQESVFIHTINEARSFTILTYAALIVCFFLDFLVPQYQTFFILCNSLALAGSSTTLFYFLYGFNLVEDVEFKENINFIQIGFLSTCLTIAACMISLFYKIETLLIKWNFKK